jgi:hypothetical protein
LTVRACLETGKPPIAERGYYGRVAGFRARLYYFSFRMILPFPVPTGQQGGDRANLLNSGETGNALK